MTDLEHARNTLSCKKLKLVIVKDNKILFSSKQPGITSLLKLVSDGIYSKTPASGGGMVLPRRMRGTRAEQKYYGCKPIDFYKDAAAADKLVGSAAAWIIACIDINNVFARTISKSALEIFKKNKINIEYNKIVHFVLNKDNSDLCPNEKKFLNIKNKSEAYKKINDILEEL